MVASKKRETVRLNHMQVVVSDILTDYTISGEGSVILLLHGWGDNQSTFSQLMEELSKRNKVVALDLPGFGKTQAPSNAWGLDDYAFFVKFFLEKLHLKPDVILGHSNGGAIAVRGIARGILTPRKLILLASAGIRNEYKGRKKALRVMAKIAKVGTSPLPKHLKAKLKKSAYQTMGSDMFVSESLQEIFKKIISDDVLSESSNIQVKTLLVYGDEDTATPVRYGEKFNNAIKDSELKVVNAGHFLHHEKPDKILRLIMDFLES